MAMSFQTKRIEFSGCKGSIATNHGYVTFDLPPAQAEVAIRGFMVQFEGSEHPVQNIQVYVENPVIDKSKVTFTGTLAIKDNSGYYDDKYGGWIEVLTIVNF